MAEDRVRVKAVLLLRAVKKKMGLLVTKVVFLFFVLKKEMKFSLPFEG